MIRRSHRPATLLPLALLAAGIAPACREVGADGFLASVDQTCPERFTRSGDRCYRTPPGEGPRDGSAPRGDAATPGRQPDAGSARPEPTDAAGGGRPSPGTTADAGADGRAPEDASPDARTCPPGGCPLVATKVTTGGYHSCAVLVDGTVRCWGGNWSNQLGIGAGPNSPVPVKVGRLTKVTAISGGRDHSCAVADGAAYCWGRNDTGQLGDGMPKVYLPDPTPVIGIPPRVTDIAADGDESCGIADGLVYCWGPYLGLAKPVAGISGATQLSLHGHACAVLAGGSVRCWGQGNHGGELGVDDPEATSATVQGLTGVTHVSVGSSFTCAIRAAGSVACWGDNLYGGLGNGSLEGSTRPVPVTGLGGVTALGAGSSAVCAVARGLVHCWGRNDTGALGNGTASSARVPVEVYGLRDATAVAHGGFVGLPGTGSHTCAVASGGAVYCWGFNAAGQLGNGTTTASAVPIEVKER